MSAQIGYIDSDGHPRLTIRICGPDPANWVEEDALIDTGFTGFLMLPEAKAFALGIVPSSTGDYTLADNSVVTNYVGTATVTVMPPSTIPGKTHLQPETKTGTVVMCGNGALVGMELLREMDKYLVVGPVVVLLDVPVVKTAIDAQQGIPPAEPPAAAKNV